MIIPSGPEWRNAAERAQPGAGDRHGLVEHDRLGFNYRLSDVAAAIGVGQLERLDCAARRLARSPTSTSGRARRAGEGDRPRARTAAPSGAAGSSTSFASRTGADRDEVIARLAERGVASKAYLPCIHLFPQLRELGYREGSFPSPKWPLPIPGAALLPTMMTEARRWTGSARSWRRRLGSRAARDNHPPMGRFRKDQTRASGASTARSSSIGAGPVRHRPVSGPRPRPARDRRARRG